MPITTSAHDQVINLPAGAAEPIIVKHRGVTIRGRGPESTIIDGRGQVADGIRGHDGCTGLTVESLGIIRCGTGAFITTARDVTLRNLIVRHCGAEGLQGGALSNLLVEDCLSEGHGRGTWSGAPLGIGPNRSHAFYFEVRGTGWEDGKRGMTMRRCQGLQCNGMGLHGRGSYLKVEECAFKENRPGNDRKGAGDVQLTSVAHALLIRCLLEDGDSGITLFNENGDCEDVEAQDCAIWEPDGAFAVSAWGSAVLRVRGGVMVGEWEREQVEEDGDCFASLVATPAAQAALAAWKAGSTPTEPPPDLDLDELRARVSELLAERDGLRQQVARLRAAMQQIHGLSEVTP